MCSRLGGRVHHTRGRSICFHLCRGKVDCEISRIHTHLNRASHSRFVSKILFFPPYLLFWFTGFYSVMQVDLIWHSPNALLFQFWVFLYGFYVYLLLGLWINKMGQQKFKAWFENVRSFERGHTHVAFCSHTLCCEPLHILSTIMHISTQNYF